MYLLVIRLREGKLICYEMCKKITFKKKGGFPKQCSWMVESGPFPCKYPMRSELGIPT